VASELTRRKIVYPDSNVTYAFDKRGRMSSLTDWRAGYGYDHDSHGLHEPP